MLWPAKVRGLSRALLLCLSLAAAGDLRAGQLDLTLRRLAETEPGSHHWRVVEQHAAWKPRQTAVVICDMWDNHWCKSAAERVGEMAPRMNQLVTELRKRGALIIHCPSDTMKFYEGTPGRKLAQSAPSVAPKVPLQRWRSLDSSRESALPIDDSGDGCDDEPECPVSYVWQRQIATIEIKAGDAITDSAEAYNLMRLRGITNVIVMGVHENKCVLGRPFATRQMVAEGQNVVLVRDLTDSLFSARRNPSVEHFTGNDLITWHIEKYWCPTITSDQILGGQPFHFAADKKPARTFGR